MPKVILFFLFLLLVVVILLFPLTRKSYEPSKRPLTEKVLFLQCLLFSYRNKIEMHATI